MDPNNAEVPNAVPTPEPQAPADAANDNAAVNAPVQPVATNEVPAQPVAPVASQVPVSNGVVAKKPMSAGAIVGIIVGVVAVIVAVLCAIFIPMAMKPDYEAIYNSARDAEKKYNIVSDYDSCLGMLYDASDEDVSNETLEGKIKTCKENIDAAKKTMEELEEAKGFKHDKEIKEAWDKFSPKKEKMFMVYDQIPVVSKDLHQFILNMDDVSDEMDDTDAMIPEGRGSEIVKPLVDSENEMLKELGLKLGEKFAKLFDLRNQAQNLAREINDSDFDLDVWMQKHEEHQDLLDELNTLEDEVSDLMDQYDENKIFGVNLEQTEDDFDTTFDALMEVIGDKYFKSIE